MRTEFEFQRTACSCEKCTSFCRHMPGYLIPADLERIRCFLGANEDLIDWAETNLCASPGALVMRQGRVFRIPTLVPARREDGACVFFNENEQCRIHANAPFGCAFFDDHQPKNEANERSIRAPPVCS